MTAQDLLSLINLDACCRNVISVVELHDVPGGGPPPHIHHREDKAFQILEGKYEFTVGGKTILAKSGTTLFAPRDGAHTYCYVGKMPGRLMCVFTRSALRNSSKKSAR